MAGNEDPFRSFSSLIADVTIIDVDGWDGVAFLAAVPFGAAVFFLDGDFLAAGDEATGAGLETTVSVIIVENSFGRLERVITMLALLCRVMGTVLVYMQFAVPTSKHS